MFSAIRVHKVPTVPCFQPSEPNKCRQFHVFSHPNPKSADSLYVFSHPNPKSVDCCMFSVIRTQKVSRVLCFQPSEPKQCRQLYVFNHLNPKSAHSCMFSIIRTQKVQTVVCFQSSEHRKGRQLYVCSSPLSFRNGKEFFFECPPPGMHVEWFCGDPNFFLSFFLSFLP